MIFNVITHFREPITMNYPVVRVLVAYDMKDAKKFLKSIGLKYYDICPQIEGI